MKKLLIALSFLMSIVAFSTSAVAGSAQLLLDARTGEVLASENPDSFNHPASLTKMMTLYMAFEAIRRGELSWNSRVPFSKYAASRPPTKLRVKAGDAITVKEAVLGMIVQSANDAAAAMAEKLGGTESQFAAMMTKRARALGMSNTTFVNASGLPDDRQITTARDMSTLGVALLRDFPQEYKLFNTKSFAFRGRTINGHNNLMYRYKGMDGIKTGYTNASGFNLVSAVTDGKRRVIGVVMGGRSAASRDKVMEKLIAGNIAKASSGTRLLASNSTRVGMDLARLGDDIPVPAPRRDAVAAVISLANATPIPATRYGTAYANPMEVAAAPVMSDVAALTPQAEIPRARPAAQAPKAGGWQIQIAAATSARLAMELLADAKAKIGGALANRDTYTEAVTRDGSTFYRARFTGFSSKSEARSACDQLVKNRYDCVLMPARG
ncbi:MULTISPECIES: D-alanyl-D-alanine carboxypeptidase [Alphaproteobacteria]|uniref:Peptidase M15 n=2 Tax=Alphaproteobacteria TaxID=28211 RepID=A0A512HFK5_9HYPH|nr:MULTISPECIES: D-alanyl-D-alanine carboxypeptidase [Alphaproteobacteria]GEO84160.1 peptidase M15 [Ciceribacter naphthalenivorans]GLR24696.1 peptidase M15 [Ciceribacter naphthalenivorans]GLT07552.1 peptidase M15 [Sphingomonas psychrolutea]